MPGNLILVIDDDESYLQLLQEIFSADGLHIITATDGTGGLTKAQSEKPDLIILDIMLEASINGFDVLKQLKLDSRTQKIPVLILTNLDNENKLAKDGAVDYLIKSDTDLDVLYKRVKDILEKNGNGIPHNNT